MKTLKISLNSADSNISSEELRAFYKEFEEFLYDNTSEIKSSQLVEENIAIAGAKGDQSTLWLLISIVPTYVQAVIQMVDYWNKKNENSGKKPTANIS